MPAYEATQWAANQTVRPSLTIGGDDYTAQLLQWNVSDASAFKNGLITTSGTLALASLGTLTGLQIEDYQKNIFKRGTEVILDLVLWDSETNQQVVTRHPRGLLYILGSSYSLTAQRLELNIGCIISLYLLDDEGNYPLLSGYAQLPLQEDQETISNIGATLAATGRAIYQDNQGNINTITYFSDDTGGTNSWDQYTGGEGEWVSINGVTAFSADPIRSAGPLPDEIELAYSQQDFDVTDDDPSAPRVTRSKYYIQYPAVIYEKIRVTGTGDPSTGTGDIPTTITVPGTGGTGGNSGGSGGGCGNTPNQPSSVSVYGTGTSVVINGILTPISTYTSTTTTGCSDDYVAIAGTKTLSAESEEISYDKFQAYGDLVSYKYKQKRGPAVELNNQYYADSLAYCVSEYADICNPSGLCGYPGRDNVIQNFQETFYEYGTGDEQGLLKAEETHVWQNVLSAAKASDWRSGVVDGIPGQFVHLSENTVFRATIRRLEYSTEGKWNKTIEKVWTSKANTGNGLSGV